MIIAHLSDLHVSGSHFVPAWAETVIDALHDVRPDLAVITGDLTTEGHADEYERALALLDRLPVERRLVVPGNHDARNEGYVLFEELFGTRYPLYENDDVVILGIDSTQPDIDDGHIGRSNYPLISSRLAPGPRLRILAMHHHLVPIPGTGRERHIPADSGDVLKLCVELGIDLVLSGHKHLPWVWRLERTCLLTGGTATSRRLKGRSAPSFNLISVQGGSVRVDEFNVATESCRNVIRLRAGAALRPDDLQRSQVSVAIEPDEEDAALGQRDLVAAG